MNFKNLFNLKDYEVYIIGGSGLIGSQIVKALEEFGIGRPSTYAAIVSTLQTRDYVELENKRFFPTDIGCVVNGPGEALISDLGVAGANRKSGFYLNGQRQKLRLDNNNIAEQLEQQVRQYLVAREQLIGIKQLD